MLNCTTLCHTVLTLFWGNCYFVVEKLEYLVAPTFGPGAALVLSTVHTLGGLCHTIVPQCTTLYHTGVVHTLGIVISASAQTPPTPPTHQPYHQQENGKPQTIWAPKCMHCNGWRWNTLTPQYISKPFTLHDTHFDSPTNFHFQLWHTGSFQK